MKPCPVCAEEIQDAAIRCRHCGADLVDAEIWELVRGWPQMDQAQREARWYAMTPERQETLRRALEVPPGAVPAPSQAPVRQNPYAPPAPSSSTGERKRTSPVTAGCAALILLFLLLGLIGMCSSETDNSNRNSSTFKPPATDGARADDESPADPDATPRRFAPGESRPIPDWAKGGSTKPMPDWAKNRPQAPPPPPPRQPARRLEIVKSSGEIDRPWITVTGTIKNTGTLPASYVKVRVDFVNTAGEVQDSDWTFAVDSSPLHPGQSRNFEIMHRYTPGADRFRTYIEP